jgi:hypothetical protein
MTTLEIQQQIDQINLEITNLQAKKNILEKELISKSETFEEKFKAWVYSSEGKHLDWIIGEREYPKIRKYMDRNIEWDRHRTYDLVDIFEEQIEALLDPDFEANEWFTEEDLKEFREVAAEMMTKNVKSFVCDW